MKHKKEILVVLSSVMILAIACRGGSGTGGSTAIPLFTPTVSSQVCENSDYPDSAPQFGDDSAIDYTVTDSGLNVFDRTEGTGKAPGPDSNVLVQYTGFLENGCIFDTSRKRSGPTAFGVTQVIPGFEEGLKGMKEGGSRRIKIPADLAYGAREIPGRIPANSTIIFEIELVKVDPPPVPSGN